MTEIRSDVYFAIVPEWVILSDVSSNAVRLYAILNRYANSQGHAWPSRKTLADAMKCSTATVDRARDELVEIRAMTVIPRKTDAGDPTSNLYILHTAPVDTVDKSSPVMKGMGIREETGIRTRDDLNRASMTQSQLRTSASMQSPSTWCTVCHGRKIVMADAWYNPDAGWVAAAPKPCPECATL